MADIEKRSDSQKTMPKVLVGLTVTALVVTCARVVFVNARRLGWTLGWIYVGLVAATLIVNLACLARWNPELIRRRMCFSWFAKTWDMVWAVLFGLAFVAIYVVAMKLTHDGVPHEPGAGWLLGLLNGFDECGTLSQNFSLLRFAEFFYLHFRFF
jgi:hypothetical protein